MLVNPRGRIYTYVYTHTSGQCARNHSRLRFTYTRCTDHNIILYGTRHDIIAYRVVPHTRVYAYTCASYTGMFKIFTAGTALQYPCRIGTSSRTDERRFHLTRIFVRGVTEHTVVVVRLRGYNKRTDARWLTCNFQNEIKYSDASKTSSVLCAYKNAGRWKFLKIYLTTILYKYLKTR